MDQEFYDVIVAGGGPAGSLAALLVARSGKRVLLADGARNPAAPSVPEILAPSGVHLLQRLGIGDLLDLPGLAPCPGVLSYWQAGRPEFTDLRRMQLSAGWILNRRVFDRALCERARAAGAAVVPARLRLADAVSHNVEAVAPDNPPPGPPVDEVRMTIEPFDGRPARVVSGSFLVEATGRGAGIDHHSRRSYADRLVAIPLTVGCCSTCDRILRLVPTRSGWWYWMDNPATMQTLIFLTDGDLLPRSRGATLSFLEAERASEPSIPDGPLNFETASPASPHGMPVYHDARTGIRRAWNQPRRFPIGDSAFSLDPLSGSGLVCAIRMASTLSDLLCGEGGLPGLAKVRSFTISAIEEFQRSRGAGMQFYAQAASRFPDSVFWARRFPGGSTA